MTNPLRPLTISELLDRTFFLYTGHFRLFVGIAALPSLIILAFNLARTLAPPFGSDVAQLLVGLVGILLLVFAYFFTIALAQGATVVAVSELQLGREASVTEAFTAIRGRIGALAGIMLGMGLRIMIGFLLFVIPGILWAIKWSLTIPVAVIEQSNLSDSLDRSAHLTEGHRWRVFLIYVLLFVLIQVVTAIVQGPLIVAVAILSRTTLQESGDLPVLAQVVLLVASFVTTSLLSPIMTIALSLVYYDERVRKEAFDLEHMMEQLDQPAVKTFPAV